MIVTPNRNKVLILIIVFLLLAIIAAVLTFVRNYSLIPVVGALCCMYLLIEIPVISWLWFFVWMGVGLVIYFTYSYRNSRLSGN